tara:strand:- start:286 stop:540 length:255 start_codon:yes stop_codon:yes gene_type:complete
MFILTEKTGGVYAVSAKENIRKKIVQAFEERDDAERYVTLLDADDYPDQLEVTEVDPEVLAYNCVNFGYKYTVISPNDFVIPDL